MNPSLSSDKNQQETNCTATVIIEYIGICKGYSKRDFAIEKQSINKDFTID